jgi:hypothetical protein
MWLAAHFLKDLLLINAAYLEHARQFCLLVEASKLDLADDGKREWTTEAIKNRPESLADSIRFLQEWTGQDLTHAALLTDLEKFCATFSNPAGGDDTLEIRMLRPKGGTAGATTEVEVFTRRFYVAQRAALFPEIFAPIIFTAFILCRDVAEAIKTGATAHTATAINA